MTKAQSIRENSLRALFFLCAALSILVTVGIILVLVFDTATFFKTVSPKAFFLGLEWAPKWDKFGVLPLVCGTVVIAFGALLLAVPIGVGTAIYLSEFAPPSVRQIAKPIFEVLSGIPSVVYGFFALTFVTPYIIKPFFNDVSSFNMLSASIVLAVMIIPTICSLCDDAFRAVPNSLRQAAHALAATPFEVSTRIVLPGALSGVFAAILLGLSRAIGETMAVALAAGMQPKLTLNPLSSGQTMTGYMVQASMGDTPFGSIEYLSIFAIGMALFAITFGINWIAQRVLARFREEYE